MSNPYLIVGNKRYWSVASVERGLGRIVDMLRERGLSDRLFVGAFNAELMREDMDESEQSQGGEGEAASG